jgi:hypothetical protein
MFLILLLITLSWLAVMAIVMAACQAAARADAHEFELARRMNVQARRRCARGSRTDPRARGSRTLTSVH